MNKYNKPPYTIDNKNKKHSRISNPGFSKPSDLRKRLEKIARKMPSSNKESCNKRKRQYAKWMRMKGDKKSKYIALDGKIYTGQKSYEMSLADKNILEKRQRIMNSFDNNKVLDDENRCQLKIYGIPKEVIASYEAKGLKKLYKWQADCLSLDGILNGKNLIYSAPTSGGKTIVAEILMIRSILSNKSKCLFVLPFISLVIEKAYDLKDKLSSIGYVVKTVHSNISVDINDEVDIIVCTIEKSNSYINKLLHEDNIWSKICVVVIDEIHMISDIHRGYLIELLLSKLILFGKNVQIIGLSATIPNISELASWLNAKYFITTYRPVPLIEMIKVEDKLLDRKGKIIKKYNKPNIHDPDHIIILCNEIITNKNSVLIFCPTKNWCKKSVSMISKYIKRELSKNIEDSRKLVIEQLKSLPNKLCKILEVSIIKGIAYHHAGMTIEERNIIEDAFRSKVIDILVATSTLAAGVNLPARRVIFRYPYVGNHFLSVLKYKQMSGRAGRMGIDKCGESILITKKKDYKKTMNLMIKQIEKIESRLKFEKNKGLNRFILELISSNSAKSMQDIKKYVKVCWNFYGVIRKEIDEEKYSKTITQSLEYLLNNKFIKLISVENNKNSDKKKKEEKINFLDTNIHIYSTSLGNATFLSGMTLEEAIFIKNEIIKASSNLAINHQIHLCYLVSPIYYNIIEPNWQIFYYIYSKLPNSVKEISRKINIEDSFMAKANYKNPKYNSTDHKTLVHKRFFIGLIIYDIINEKSISSISSKYGIQKGQIQALQIMTSTFSNMISVFCKRLNWDIMASLILHFSERINFGVHSELLPLLKIPHIKSFKARSLYDSGFTTVDSIANADLHQIKKAISKYRSDYNSLSKKEEKYKEQIEYLMAKKIINNAKNIINNEIKELEEKLKNLDKLNRTYSKNDKNNISKRINNQNEELDEMKELFENALLNVD